MLKKYVEFELVATKSKTNVYSVLSRSSGDFLGEIKWYGPWRQYCFFPAQQTVWSKGCLAEVNSFIQKLMDKRKKRGVS